MSRIVEIQVKITDELCRLCGEIEIAVGFPGAIRIREFSVNEVVGQKWDRNS
jgi:hypothetical protein